MLRRLPRASRAIRICAAIGLAGASSAGSGAARPWTLLDSIGMQYVAPYPSTPAYLVEAQDGIALSPRPVVESPDGKYFYFLRSWGDLDSDSDVSELRVYRSDVVAASLKRHAFGNSTDELPPDHIVTMRSRSLPVAAMANASWDADSRYVRFLAVNEHGGREAYQLDVQSGRLTRLEGIASSYGEGIQEFNTRGDGFVFSAIRHTPVTGSPYPVEWVARRPDGTLVSGGDVLVSAAKRALYVAYRGGPPLEVDLQGWSINPERLAISPDGRWAIGAVYRSLSGRLEAHFISLEIEHAKIMELPIRGGTRPLYPGSMLRPPLPSASWSADGAKVVFVNALAGDFDVSVPRDDVWGSIIEYDFASGQSRVLEPLRHEGNATNVSDVKWLSPGRDLYVGHLRDDKPVSGTIYSFNRGATQSRLTAAVLPAASQLAGGLAVKVMQDANTPPRVIATDGKREILLLGPSITPERVRLQPVRSFQWRDPDGQTVTGGLTLPARANNGGPAPLVIQSSFYAPDVFLPDGSSRSADAAQALAARGIAVLQINYVVATKAHPVHEGQMFVNRIDAAVDALTKVGIVDPARVGVTGFSHAGYEVLYAITHPGRVRLAAAMGSDSFTGSYGAYLDMSSTVFGRAGAAEYFELPAGVGPFWSHKQRWLETETSFNVDRVVTPYMVTSHMGRAREIEPDSAPRQDDPYVVGIVGAFLLNDKPLEYLYFGYAGHVLIAPRARMASLSAMVDWMSFWLQGYEDPAPEKVQQYARWRPMRAQQDRSLARSRNLPVGAAAE